MTAVTYRANLIKERDELLEYAAQADQHKHTVKAAQFRKQARALIDEIAKVDDGTSWVFEQDTQPVRVNLTKKVMRT